MNNSKVKSGKTRFYAVVIAASLATAGGLLAMYTSQAYADRPSTYGDHGNGTMMHGDFGQWIKAMIVKDIRDHHDMRWTGLTTDSHSLVPDVKILGVTEKDNSTVTVTLAHVSKPDANGDVAIDNSAVNENVTLSATVFHSHLDASGHMDGSATISPGWSGTTSVDVKVAGKGSLFDYHFIRVVAVQ
jgi:hypothetical protein